MTAKRIINTVFVDIDAERLRAAIQKSPFTTTQINRYLRRNSTFVSDSLAKGKFGAEDYTAMCALLGLREDEFVVKPEIRPEAEPEARAKPARTSRNDASQNWMVNIYRAVENQNDGITALQADIADNTNAVRGVRQAIVEQTQILREMKSLLGEIKVAAESLRTSEQYSAQETKKQLDKIYNVVQYGRNS